MMAPLMQLHQRRHKNSHAKGGEWTNEEKKGRPIFFLSLVRPLAWFIIELGYFSGSGSTWTDTFPFNINMQDNELHLATWCRLQPHANLHLPCHNLRWRARFHRHMSQQCMAAAGPAPAAIPWHPAKIRKPPIRKNCKVCTWGVNTQAELEEAAVF